MHAGASGQGRQTTRGGAARPARVAAVRAPPLPALRRLSAPPPPAPLPHTRLPPVRNAHLGITVRTPLLRAIAGTSLRKQPPSPHAAARRPRAAPMTSQLNKGNLRLTTRENTLLFRGTLASHAAAPTAPRTTRLADGSTWRGTLRALPLRGRLGRPPHGSRWRTAHTLTSQSTHGCSLALRTWLAAPTHIS